MRLFEKSVEICRIRWVCGKKNIQHCRYNETFSICQSEFISDSKFNVLLDTETSSAWQELAISYLQTNTLVLSIWIYFRFLNFYIKPKLRIRNPKIIILKSSFARGMAAEILCGTKWSKDCSVQPDLKFTTDCFVPRNDINEGRAQKNKNTIFVPYLINNQQKFHQWKRFKTSISKTKKP